MMTSRRCLSLSWLVFYLILLFSFLCSGLAENTTNTSNTNSTLFSRTKNQTKIVYVSCEWSEVRPTYSIIPAVISGVLIIVGGVLCSFGFRQQRTSFSLLGFTVAGLVGYAIVEYRFDYSMAIQLLITGAMALFVSILSSSVLYCGIFLTGLCTGFSLGCITILIIAEMQHSFSSFAEPVFILLGLAIAFASATLWWKRAFIIVGTSVAGGAFIMGGMDYFIEGFLFTEHIQHILYNQKFRKLCYFSWIVFAVFPVVSVIGVLVQYFKTAKLQKNPTSLSHEALAMNHEALAMNHMSSTSQQSRV